MGKRSLLKSIQKARCYSPQQVPCFLQEGRLRRYPGRWCHPAWHASQVLPRKDWQSFRCQQARRRCRLQQARVVSLLLATDGHLLLLEGGESAAVGTILFLSEVDGGVLLLFEFISCSIDALLGKNGENLGNVLSDLSDLGQLHLGLGRDLGHSQRCKFLAVLGQLLHKRGLLVLSKLVSH